MSATATLEREYLNEVEVSQLTGIAVPTLQSWRCRKVGGFPFIRVSRGMVKYRRSDIERWMEARMVTPMESAAN